MAERDSDWIFLDDAPADIRRHSFFRAHPRNRDDLFARLKELQPVYPTIFAADGNFIFRPVDKNTARDGGHLTEEKKASDLQRAAAAFAQVLLDSIPPAERIKLAAPPPANLQRRRTCAFNPRHPEFIPDRHQDYLAAGDRKFAEVALTSGRSAHHAARMRAELTLVFLVSGSEPPWPVVDGRRPGRDDEGPLAATFTKRLWDAHEDALREAEARKLLGDGTKPLLSKHGKLLAEFYAAATLVKVGSVSVMSYRALFRALGNIVDSCRENI